MIEVVEYPEDRPEAVAEEFKDRVFATAEESVEWATAFFPAARPTVRTAPGPMST